MGLRIGRGPSWGEDSLGYINTQVSSLPSRLKQEREEEYLSVINRNPVVSRQYGNNPEEE